MTITKLARIFGIIFVVIGILGFVPGITKDEMLLGIFHVNTAHNFVHIISGLVALWCGGTSLSASRLFFQAFGLIYGLVAVMGLIVPHGMIFGLISNNPADTMLHLAISLSSLFIGYLYGPKRTTS